MAISRDFKRFIFANNVGATKKLCKSLGVSSNCVLGHKMKAGDLRMCWKEYVKNRLNAKYNPEGESIFSWDAWQNTINDGLNLLTASL